MKRLLLCVLAAIPLCLFATNFVYADYDYDYNGDQYWHDEYWHEYGWHDHHWVYYPHGYYCVRYVWWYPWWWDWYWWRARWCHYWHWDFFYAGFYVVWYRDGCWWFRPRYGRWVRYRLPYSYHELRYRAKLRGVYLPEKAPREINIPYKEHEVKKLIEKKDPDLYKRIEKEHKSGNLEKMQKEYTKKIDKEIKQKNIEYKAKAPAKNIEKSNYDMKAPENYNNKKYQPYNDMENKSGSKNANTHIKKKSKSVQTSDEKIHPYNKNDNKEKGEHYYDNREKRNTYDNKEKQEYPSRDYEDKGKDSYKSYNDDYKRPDKKTEKKPSSNKSYNDNKKSFQKPNTPKKR